MEIDFVGGAYQTFSKYLNAQECVNFIPTADQEAQALRGTPGLKEWVDSGVFAEVRGAKEFNGSLYAVVGNTVYKITKEKTATACTGTLTTSTGALPETTMATNQTQLMIVDGRFGYIVTGTTVTQITDDGLASSPKTVTHQDGYFITTHEGSGRCYISDLNDGTSWDGTNYFNAEANPDDSLCAVSHHRRVTVFGQKTMESWYDSGNTVPFDRIPGTTQEVGISAYKSPVILDNTVYCLTDSNQVVMLEGNNPRVIAPPGVEYQISKYSKTDDAIGMAIKNLEGHTFYILSFPSANETWGFDVITKHPFKLSSYPEGYENRWRGNCYCYFDGKHIVGDYENGKLYEFDFDTYTDNGEYIRRIRTCKAIKKENKNLFHYELELILEAGVGITTGQGSDPQVMLRYSDDGGRTWSNEIWRSAGKIGKSTWRVVWYRLGASRHRNYQIAMSDPVKWVITGSNLEVEVGIT